MKSRVDENQIKVDCKGGGRIKVDPGTRTISVYGYSQVRDWLINYLMYQIFYVQEFGRADHDKTVEILKKKYPQWTIKVSGICILKILFYCLTK